LSGDLTVWESISAVRGAESIWGGLPWEMWSDFLDIQAHRLRATIKDKKVAKFLILCFFITL
jgi:hypothetical protein